MKNCIYAIGFILLCFNFSYGQQDAVKNSLAIGDNIPDVIWKTMLTNRKDEAALSKLKGRWIILDFWNVRCGACIQAMPKLDSLQEEFKEQLEIVLVTKDSPEKVNALFSRINRKRPDLPMINADKVIHTMFPHQGQPYQAWIDPSGKITYITDGYNANRETVASVIGGTSLKLSRADTKVFNVSNSVATYLHEKKIQATSFSAVFTQGLENDFIPGFSIERVPGSKDVHTIRIINQTALDMLRFAYDGDIFWEGFNTSLYLRNTSRTIIEARDTELLSYPKEKSEIDNWKRKALYSYELVTAAVPLKRALEIAKKDLSLHLKYKAKIEDRSVDCYVVQKGNDFTQKQKNFANDTVVFAGYEKDGSGYRLSSKPLQLFIRELVTANSFSGQLPIVDGTDYKDPVHIPAIPNLADIELVKKRIQACGFNIVRETRRIPMLIISDI